jgi:hypothetical protein
MMLSSAAVTAQAAHLSNATANDNSHPLAMALRDYMERHEVSRANLVTLSRDGEIGVIAVIDDLSSFQLLYMNNGEVLSHQLGDLQDIQIVIGSYGLWVGSGSTSWTFDKVYVLESGRLVSTSWSWRGANVSESGLDEHTFNEQNVTADEYNVLVGEIMMRHGIVLSEDALTPWSRDDTTQILAMTVSDPAGTTDPLSSASGWARDYLISAIGHNLVPTHLQSDYRQAATRAEFAALAVRLYETVTGDEIDGRRVFVDTDDVNAQKLGAIGVTDGVGNDRFDPAATLTREQAATMIVRLAGVIGQPIFAESPAFADNADISDWAFNAVGAMQASGIMIGVGDNRFAPQDPYTREQSIIIMLRLFELMS